MKMSKKMDVQGKAVAVISVEQQNYISLTDIAKHRNIDAPADVVKNWIRSRSTIEFLGLWEKLNNPVFKLVEFDQFRNEAGHNYFVLSPFKWVDMTGAVGIVTKSGRNGGTYAHKDIAFEFASWISPSFKLYLIKEFQRFKEQGNKQLGWDIRRNLAKINYRIHTDAVKEKLIPGTLRKEQVAVVYANEADVLNTALFGFTAKEWRERNPGHRGNVRDHADISQLVCLSNLENLNALFIKEGMSQAERLVKLNTIAIQQMKLLVDDVQIERLRKQ